jgi:hypothetical protein
MSLFYQSRKFAAGKGGIMELAVKGKVPIFLTAAQAARAFLDSG